MALCAQDENWSEQKVLEEIAYAFQNADFYDENRLERWKGKTRSGFEFRGFARSGKIESAFPDIP